MRQVQLLHWNADEAKERAGRLKALGCDVTSDLPAGPALLRALRQDPPVAIVIDLARPPSQGRDVGLSIRQYGATRHVPLVFVGGDPKKVARVQELLPDAVYTSWEEIQNPLAQAIAHPPEDPVVPGSVFAAYAGRPLSRKLGIKAGSTVGLANAPDGFEGTLGELPEGAELHGQVCNGCDLIIWFVRSSDELQAQIEGMAARLEQGAMWIAWPKRASGAAPDLSQQVVRETGLATGLVDYKICAIDETWSALLFTRRKSE
jgi:CheY-like chemotaxis protein